MSLSEILVLGSLFRIICDVLEDVVVTESNGQMSLDSAKKIMSTLPTF